LELVHGGFAPPDKFVMIEDTAAAAVVVILKKGKEPTSLNGVSRRIRN